MSRIETTNLPKLKPLVSFGLVIIFSQIALSGLVSANYAGISCIGFPKCSGQWRPSLNFVNAFNLFKEIGENYQGGLLDNESRATLQVILRLGAGITTTYLLLLSAFVFGTPVEKTIKAVTAAIVIAIIVQFTLGALNVFYLLPISIELLHNTFAAILLSLITSLRYLVSDSRGANTNGI